MFTEPGDVVFLARPRPVATLDAEGGAAVISPVRILRVTPGAPLVAAAIAQHIAAASNPDWRSWSWPTLAQAEVLAEALMGLATARERLLAELSQLDQFTEDFISAAESGQLSITKENHGQSQS